jgi:hypothetical protein
MLSYSEEYDNVRTPSGRNNEMCKDVEGEIQ